MNEQKIRHQVEHYFGDANMRRDKWLIEEVKKDSQGYVSLASVCNFNKMKELGATDSSKVAEILKTSEVVEISEDNTKIRRKHPLPDQDDSDDRTLYAKGFPAETTLEALQEFWAKHGNILLITMRRIGKKFKGSVFVQFATKEEAEAALAKKDEIKFNDQALEISTYKAWDEEKKSSGQQRKEENKEKKRKLEEEKEQDKERQKQEFLESLKTREIPQGLVLKVEGIPEGTRRENFAELYKEIGSIKFIEFSMGQPVAHIRFNDSIAESIEKIKALKLNDKELTVGLLEGDELKEYWIKLWTLQHEKQNSGPAQSRGNFKKRR